MIFSRFYIVWTYGKLNYYYQDYPQTHLMISDNHSTYIFGITMKQGFGHFNTEN